MNPVDLESITHSHSHRRALLRRLSLALLAALLTALALGGLGYPDTSLGSVIDPAAACGTGTCPDGSAT